MSNEMLQHRLDSLLKDSNRVRYIFSNYARTNNGIYALMDIKSHNKDRLIELHNIISEGIHKVEHIEENVDSLFLAVMNPEDVEAAISEVELPPEAGGNPEGWLAPGTYEPVDRASAGEIVQTMVDRRVAQRTPYQARVFSRAR